MAMMYLKANFCDWLYEVCQETFDLMSDSKHIN